MKRFDRALSILLLLRAEKALSAPELARRLEVSVRTIYRDIETLNAVGVPVYAETGRDGGFRLVDGYFLPPVAFTRGEATSLLTGLAILARLRVRPFANELDSAAKKLLAAIPDSLHTTLSQVHGMINFETLPTDIFHPERGTATQQPTVSGNNLEAQVLTVFLQSIFQQRLVELNYQSPYSHERKVPPFMAVPYGIIWDRDLWYLVGRKLTGAPEPRLWRADRVVHITVRPEPIEDEKEFDLTQLLNRSWLTQAIAEWAEQAPVRIRMTQAQADRLKQDWYYAHARFEELSEGKVTMSFGESSQSFVFELLRWLGPDAELIAPQTWRTAFAKQLRAILNTYDPV